MAGFSVREGIGRLMTIARIARGRDELLGLDSLEVERLIVRVGTRLGRGRYSLDSIERALKEEMCETAVSNFDALERVLG